LILLKNRSIKFRARYRYGLKQITPLVASSTANQHVRNHPRTGHAAEMPESTKMTLSGQSTKSLRDSGACLRSRPISRRWRAKIEGAVESQLLAAE
jgi:hypothetical protein